MSVRKALRQNSLSLFFGLILLLDARRPGVHRAGGVQLDGRRRRPAADEHRRVRHVVAVRRRRRGELAVRVPPVPALHRAHRSGWSSAAPRSPSRSARRAARTTRSRSSAAHASRSRRVGTRGRLADGAVLQLARHRHGAVLPRLVGRPAGGRHERLQQRPAAEPPRAGLDRPSTPSRRTSGTAPSRTGSRSSSRSAAWSSSASTCGSVGRRSRSRWGRRTPRPGVEG